MYELGGPCHLYRGAAKSFTGFLLGTAFMVKGDVLFLFLFRLCLINKESLGILGFKDQMFNLSLIKALWKIIHNPWPFPHFVPLPSENIIVFYCVLHNATKQSCT